METKKSDIIDNRHIINPHVDGVTGKTQMEVNEELSSKFITLNPEHPLFQKLSKDVEFLNKGILVINNDSEDPSIYIKDTEGNIVKISGNGSMTVNNAEEAINEASTNNIGQLIYIQENSSYSGENYSLGPYIVIGDKTIIKLSTSTPSGDISGDVVILKNDIKELKDGFNELNEVIGSEEEFTGIFGKIKEVQDNLDYINIPDVPVQDVKVNGESVLDKEGVANITFTIPEIDLPDFNAFEKVVDANVVRERIKSAEEMITALQSKDAEFATAIDGKIAKEEGKSLVADDEIAKLATVAERAQVNVIESISVNGKELEITDDKSVNITINQELIGAEDIIVKSIEIANQGYGKMDVVNTITENKPTIEKSIEILQNNIAALTMAMSASLNEFNTLIQEMKKDIDDLKRTE